MMIAARNAFLMSGGGPTPWVNPYITDGLVAMWDGEWNAGGGVHDNTVTNWWDASGNQHSFCAETPIWGDNYSASDGTFASCFHCATAADSQWFWDLLATGLYTIEFAYEKYESHGNGIYFTCGYDNTYTPGLLTRYAAINANNTGTYVWKKGGANSEIMISGNYLAAKLFQMSCNGSSCTLSLHGSGTSASADLAWDTAINIDTSGGKGNMFRYAFGCRGDGYNPGLSQGCRLYRLAIYSRALTAAEVAANYAIDAARFGL